MREIDSYFESSVGETLYHYTGIGALLSIAESNSLWASNIYYLNDSKEIYHACEIFKSVLKKVLEGDGRDPDEKEFLTQLGNWITGSRGNLFNIFVFSLSEHSSLLSQWRSYTPHGKGVSVGVSAKTINGLVAAHNLRVGKCLYNTVDQAKLVGSLINTMILTFRKKSSGIDTSSKHSPTCYYEFLNEFRGDVLQVLALIKHKSFIEEQEWRLVSPYFESFRTPVIRYREGASMLVPYIELDLGNEKPLFEQVILGPSTYPDLSFSALSQFLSNKSICDWVKTSSIPYREW